VISRARRRFVALPGLCDYPWGHSEADAGHRDRVCSMTQARGSARSFVATGSRNGAIALRCELITAFVFAVAFLGCQAQSI